jgi:cytochrome c556
MKAMFFAAAAVTALALAACGGEAPKTEEPTPAAEAPAPAPAPEPVATAASDMPPATDVAAFMKARHEKYEDLGKNFKVMMDATKVDAPDMAAVSAAAAKVQEYAGQMGTWFPAGTGPDSGIESEAKANIWTDRATFDAALTKLQDESAKMVTAAGTDAAAFKGQFRNLGGACKNCHDTFREEKKD